MSVSFSYLDVIVLLVASPVLLSTFFFDLREMRIPNWLSLAGIGLFVCLAPLLGFDEAAMRIAVSAAVFGACFALFAIGWLGGGDAKMLPVSILFLPSSCLPIYSYAFSITMITGMAFVWAARRAFGHAESGWVSMRPDAAFPMGVSIGTAPFLTLAITLALT